MPEKDLPMNDPLSGLLGALLGGHPAVQDHMQNTGQSMDQVLASISGSANAASDNATDSTPQASEADPLSAMLGGLLSGSPAAQNPGGDAMSSILGGLLGGAAMPHQMQASGDPMSTILSRMLGGGMPGGASTSSGLSNNSFLAPIVEALAGKIGIPPQIAGAVVSFAVTQLMGGQGDAQLSQMLGTRGTVSQKYLRDSGLVDQLTQQTGLDNKTATKSLQHVLQAFGTQMGEGTSDDRQQGLQSWLQSM